MDRALSLWGGEIKRTDVEVLKQVKDPRLFISASITMNPSQAIILSKSTRML